MELKQLNRNFVVCKLDATHTVDLNKEFTFLAKTDDEISLVCDVVDMPPNTTEIETGWKGLKIHGILDFGMIGVIAKISGLLAEHKISIFVVSTFNTDFIFLKDERYCDAVDVLRENGYTIW